MTTIYRLSANEISTGFIESIKAAYQDKQVEITVFDSGLEEETYYLKDYAAERDHMDFWWPDEEDIYKDLDRNENL